MTGGNIILNAPGEKIRRHNQKMKPRREALRIGGRGPDAQVLVVRGKLC